MFIKRTILCSLWLFAIALFAQGVSVDTIRVNAHRISEAVRSAAPMQQIDRTGLDRMGVEGVADAVKHMSGVQVKDYGGIGGLKTVSIRGLGAQHTAVVYDGVAVSDLQTGQIDLSRYSLDNVEAISLTAGQGNNIYQSAKAFASAGVVEITTMADCTLKAKVQTGSFGLINPSVLMRTRVNNNKVMLSAYADWLHADGGYNFTINSHNNNISGKRNNSDVEALKAEANIVSQLTDRQTLTAKFYLYDSERGLPGGVIIDNPYAAERLFDRNYFGQMKYENRLSERLKFQVNGKYNWSWNRYTDHDIAKTTDARYIQSEAYANAIVWVQPIRNFSASLAQDFTYSHLHTNLNGCQFPSRYNWQTAVASQYSNSRITATASLLYTGINDKVRIGKALENQSHLSPAFSIAWRPLSQSSWRIRASYKGIFRMPTFNDLYYTLVGNHELSPEKTRQWNVGTSWSKPLNGKINYIHLSADAFMGRVNDKIIAIPKMFFWSMYNVGKVHTKGIDFNATIEGNICKQVRAYASTAYSFLTAEDRTDQEGSTYKLQIPYTPKHSGSASLTIENPWVSLTYNLLWSGERYALPQHTDNNRINSYTDHSVSLFHTFPIGRKEKGSDLKLKFDLLNIGGKNYEVVKFYPMPGRNFRLTATYSIN